jgi:hypothetical protein
MMMVSAGLMFDAVPIIYSLCNLTFEKTLTLIIGLGKFNKASWPKLGFVQVSDNN